MGFPFKHLSHQLCILMNINIGLTIGLAFSIWDGNRDKKKTPVFFPSMAILNIYQYYICNWIADSCKKRKLDCESAFGWLGTKIFNHFYSLLCLRCFFNRHCSQGVLVFLTKIYLSGNCSRGTRVEEYVQDNWDSSNAGRPGTFVDHRWMVDVTYGTAGCDLGVHATPEPSYRSTHFTFHLFAISYMYSSIPMAIVTLLLLYIYLHWNFCERERTRSYRDACMKENKNATVDEWMSRTKEEISCQFDWDMERKLISFLTGKKHIRISYIQIHATHTHRRKHRSWS